MSRITSTLKVAIAPVDLAVPVILPDPWPRLAAGGLDQDLVVRAKGFCLQCERLGFGEQGRELLRLFGEGFERRFDPTPFEPAAGDPDRELKVRFLSALLQLDAEFAGRISTVTWEALAYLGTRDNPSEEQSILSQAEKLPMPYWLADTVYHAAGKVFGLKHHIDSAIFAATGSVLEHNCDCNCAIQKLDEDGRVIASLPRHRFIVATAALFSHQLSEGLLITGLHLPFEMGVSPEAAEAMALA